MKKLPQNVDTEPKTWYSKTVSIFIILYMGELYPNATRCCFCGVFSEDEKPRRWSFLEKKKHNPSLTPRARELRKNMTAEERRLWHCFLKSYPVRFLRQKVIQHYIVDFYCAKAKLVIEIDGSQHFEEAAEKYDRRRTAVLEQWGLLVLRIPNNEINGNFDNICGYIDYVVKNRMQNIEWRDDR